MIRRSQQMVRDVARLATPVRVLMILHRRPEGSGPKMWKIAPMSAR
jgi:hypothetical protein